MRTRTLLSALVTLAVACSPAPDDEHDGVAPEDAVHSEAEEADEHEQGPIELTAKQMTSAGVQTLLAGPGTVESTLRLAATAAPDLDARSHVTPRVRGLARSIQVGLGDTVRKGDVLCEIDSPEFGRLVSAYITAAATLAMDEQTLAGERALLERNVELAQEVFDREEDLAEQGIATLAGRYEAETRLQDARLRRDSRLLELGARVAKARIDLVAAERELEILGVPHDDLPSIASAASEPHATLGTYAIRAPRGGVIMSRGVSDAEFVDTATILFTIQDLTRVWVQGSIYEQDLPRVRRGAKAIVRLDAFPNETFAGEVAVIDSAISPTTRAAGVRVVLENEPIPSWSEPFPVRPGMFGSVEVTTGEVQAAVVVPESALVHEADGDFVFVEVGEGRFELSPVVTGAAAGDQVEILEGLVAGDLVVSAGTFLLKSAARSDELGEGDDD